MIKGSDFRSKEYELFLERSEEIGLDQTVIETSRKEMVMDIS